MWYIHPSPLYRSHSNKPFSFDPNSMATALDRLLGNAAPKLDFYRLCAAIILTGFVTV